MGCFPSAEEKKEESKKKDLLRIRIITWNVDSQSCRDDFKELLQYNNDELIDIIAIGLQETVTLNAKNVVQSKNAATQRSDWEQKVLRLLNNIGTETYTLLTSTHLLAMLLMIYIRNDKKLLSNDGITEVMSSKIASGFMNSVGNKGAVGVRLKLFEKLRVCFVNMHLAAHQNKVKERNQDYAKVVSRMKFSSGGTKKGSAPDLKAESDENQTKLEQHGSTSSSSELYPFAGGGGGENKRGGVGIEDGHDLVFMFGDLNYRLGFNDNERNMVMELIERKEYKHILQKDQLKNEMIDDKIFNGFREHYIMFAPTFKYIPEDPENKFEDTKKRMPSYCDRILWKVNHESLVLQCREYKSSMKRLMSDHKPVVANFECEFDAFMKR